MKMTDSKDNLLNSKVLLVDDRKENLLALEALISNASTEIFKAHSAREALELLLIHDFALALLDVQMPEINGFELAELMRGAERSKTVPIIFVTAGAIDSRSTFRGYDAGAVDFLYKPLDPKIVAGKVQIFLELDRQKKMLSHQLDEMNRARNELKLAKEVAEAANASKSAFLANMSHEIRTPLGAILGFAEMLKDKELGPVDKEKYLEIILRNGTTLSKLIDDILDLAKVEAGRLNIERVVFSPMELIEDVAQTLKHRAQDKGLKFQVKYASEIPERIATDPLRLRQILINILGNAVKFTSKGFVEMEVSCLKSADLKSCRLVFNIVDTGLGISADQQAALFQSFSQADSSTTRKFGGTGLGLVLSRRLASLLGGNVYLKPQKTDIGSHFVIEIEAQLAQLSSATRSRADDQAMVSKNKASLLRGVKVLVVEDSIDNQILVKLFLTKQGASVDFASNGEKGIEQALKQDYDVVLMDIQMPIMDGHTATERLRTMGYTKPIVSLSAHAMREEQDRSLKVGCNAHLIKPINREKLIETVSFFSKKKTYSH